MNRLCQLGRSLAGGDGAAWRTERLKVRVRLIRWKLFNFGSVNFVSYDENIYAVSFSQHIVF